MLNGQFSCCRWPTRGCLLLRQLTFQYANATLQVLHAKERDHCNGDRNPEYRQCNYGYTRDQTIHRPPYAIGSEGYSEKSGFSGDPFFMPGVVAR